MAMLPEIVGALITDRLNAAGLPGASIAVSALKAFLKRRGDEARDILLEELRSGAIVPAQAAANDDAIAAVHRYLMASWQGSARVNLRLMAKAIVGRMRTNKLVADEFLPHADALAALSRDEIILIAEMYRIQSRFENAEPSGDRWRDTLAKMKQMGWSQDHVLGTAGRALRSGYVVMGSAYGALVFWLSPLLMDLCKTVDFDDALRRETKDAASE